MKFHPISALALAAVLALGAIGGAKAAPPPKKKLLVVTHTTGFRHADTIGPAGGKGIAQQILAEIGEKSGTYTVDYCLNQDDVTKMLTPAYLNANHYDGVIFANTTGNLHIPDLKAFADWIAAGHAFIGTHSAGDTYHPSDTDGDTTYIDMVAAEFRTHGAQAEVDCIVEDPKHPAVKHMAPSYKVKDEIYHYRVNNRDKVHVLLALKTQGMDGVKDEKGVDGSGKPTDMLISWCKMHGKGRVFYTALGHRPDVWQSEPYQLHLLGGIRWALGLAKGDATPGAAKRAASLPEGGSQLIPNVSISDADLKTSINRLKAQMGIEIVLEEPAGKSYGIVNVTLTNRSFDYVLNKVAASAGAVLRVENGIYVVGPKTP